MKVIWIMSGVDVCIRCYDTCLAGESGQRVNIWVHRGDRDKMSSIGNEVETMKMSFVAKMRDKL